MTQELVHEQDSHGPNMADVASRIGRADQMIGLISPNPRLTQHVPVRSDALRGEMYDITYDTASAAQDMPQNERQNIGGRR